MAGFTQLTNDDDREKKASYHKPGTFNTVLRPSSFAATTTDREGDQDLIPLMTYSPMTTSASRRRKSIHAISSDTNWVFLDKFEEDASGGGSGSRRCDESQNEDAQVSDDAVVVKPDSPQPQPYHHHQHQHQTMGNSPPHSVHSQPFSSPPSSMLYNLPGLRQYHSNPTDHTYYPITHDTTVNYATNTIPPMLSRISHEHNMWRDSEQQRNQQQLLRNQMQGLHMPHDSQMNDDNGQFLHNNDTMGNTMNNRILPPYRRVSIPYSSTSGSMLEKIVGLGNAPFYSTTSTNRFMEVGGDDGSGGGEYLGLQQQQQQQHQRGQGMGQPQQQQEAHQQHQHQHFEQQQHYQNQG